MAEVFVNQFVSRHGVPSEIHTDQGKNFESQLFSRLMRLLGIKKTRTTALQPQSDGSRTSASDVNKLFSEIHL